MIKSLGWVTTKAARGLDEDEPLALRALSLSGVEVAVVDWDDSQVDWARFDRVVLRSAWDYAEQLTRFLAWVDAVDEVTELRNPPAMVRWSVDKRYLLELEAAGVPIVPTNVVEPGEEPVFPSGDIVVKPAVGAGSRDAASYGAADLDLARGHVRRLQDQDRSVLVQPQLASVALDGEWPMIYLGGGYSHAASKRVALPRGGHVEGLFAAEANTTHTADAEQLAVANAAIEYVTSRLGVPTYARVDVVRDDDGQPCVLELELVEPSLFLPQADPGALTRLVDALVS